MIEVKIKGWNCINCAYCRYSKRFDYYWCVERPEHDNEISDPYEEGCSWGKDIEPEYEDEDLAYERKKYPFD